MSQAETHNTERQDSEVKTPRRTFSVQEKLRILEEADACTEPGDIGALVRREGIYTSYLSRWRKAREQGQLDGLSSKKRGPKTKVAGKMAKENEALRQENQQLRARLEQAEIIIDVQKNSQRCLVWR